MNAGLANDIWLFQEVLQPHIATLQQTLPGYAAVFSPYLGSKGTAIFWNSAKFEPVGAALPFTFQETGWDSTKGGIAQVLRRLSDQKEFLAVCVHFAATGRAGPRTKQAKEAVSLLAAWANLPWIFGGDLNTVWRTAEGCYRYLVSEGLVPTLGSTPMSHKSGLRLDHILVRGMTVIDGEVRMEADESDHFPVFARLDLP